MAKKTKRRRKSSKSTARRSTPRKTLVLKLSAKDVRELRKVGFEAKKVPGRRQGYTIHRTSKKSETDFASERVYVGKGLTKKEAIRKARGKWKHDHRGFSYDPKTGYASAT